MKKKKGAEEEEQNEEKSKEQHPGPGDKCCGHRRLEAGPAAALAGPFQQDSRFVCKALEGTVLAPEGTNSSLLQKYFLPSL